MKSSNAVIDSQNTLDGTPQPATDSTDQVLSSFEFLPAGDAFGVCDMSGECS